MIFFSKVHSDAESIDVEHLSYHLTRLLFSLMFWSKLTEKAGIKVLNHTISEALSQLARNQLIKQVLKSFVLVFDGCLIALMETFDDEFVVLPSELYLAYQLRRTVKYLLVER